MRKQEERAAVWVVGWVAEYNKLRWRGGTVAKTFPEMRRRNVPTRKGAFAPRGGGVGLGKGTHTAARRIFTANILTFLNKHPSNPSIF